MVEFEFDAAGKNLNVLSPLGNAAAKFSADQLLALLKRARTAAAGPLLLPGQRSEVVPGRPELFDLQHDRCVPAWHPGSHGEDGGDTHPLWDTNRWPVNGQQPVIQQPMFQQPVIQNAPVVAQGLANSTWIGTEKLANYGRLEFRFQGNGQVAMIDSDGTQKGTYTQTGNTVTLRFYQGTVVYTGTITGQTLVGTASNGKTTWSFSVNR